LILFEHADLKFFMIVAFRSGVSLIIGHVNLAKEKTMCYGLIFEMLLVSKLLYLL
jgi:hypothetical protein